MSRIRKPAVKWFIVGAIASVVLIWGGWQGVHYTSTTEFCLSCHAMSTVGEEYKQSAHFKNASGVRAECKDCHIPPGIVPTLWRKTQALNDLWHTVVSPSIDTPEKFEQKRAELAKREWARMSDNNSAACKSCHSYEAMDHAKQSAAAATQMTSAAIKDSNCIDCHKGIAHHKPNMSSGFRSQFKELVQQNQQPAKAPALFTLVEQPFTATAGVAAGKAVLMPATEVRVLGREGDNLQVEVIGWRESGGRGRVITQYRGKRVFSAVLDDSLTASVKVLKTEMDPDSHQQWQQISVTGWTRSSGYTASIDALWGYADQMLQSTCSSCHSVPVTTQYTANGWIAGLKAMSAYYRLSKEEERTLLKYLQTHASDISVAKPE